MQTICHTYYFDISKPADKAAYVQLRETLTDMGLKCFASWGGKMRHYNPELSEKLLTLETSALFNNQWNTAPVAGISELGLRVFDWSEDIWDNKFIKSGQWLDQTNEMREVRRNTMKCGYCGKQEPAQKGYVFCPHCLDSEHLKIADLPLTRMVAIEDTGKPRAALTPAESAYLLPLYKQAQTVGSTERGKARLKKFRADIEAKCKRVRHDAQEERDGMIWLLDAGLSAALVSNCIYYSHKSQFCFGWRTPVEAEMVSAILDVISEFPYSYEIRCADGRVLNGD